MSFMEYAEKIFDQMTQRDIVSWNALVCGYMWSGYCQEMFEDLQDMLVGSLMPSVSSWVSVIPICMLVGEFSSGKSLHAFAIQCDVLEDEVMISTLVSMYVCSNDLYYVRKLFKVMFEQHLVSWNAIILAYAKVGKLSEGYGFFQLMHNDMRLNLLRLMSILPSRGNLENACDGEFVHIIGITFGLTYNVGVLFALVSMHSKLRELDAT